MEKSLLKESTFPASEVRVKVRKGKSSPVKTEQPAPNKTGETKLGFVLLLFLARHKISFRVPWT